MIKRLAWITDLKQCDLDDLIYNIGPYQKNRLTIIEKFQIAIQLAEGIEELHNEPLPLSHNDLKPPNCFVQKRT